PHISFSTTFSCSLVFFFLMLPPPPRSTLFPYTTLFRSNSSVEEIRQFIGADSLGYLSTEGMLEAFGRPLQATCAACFTGVYPVEDRKSTRLNSSHVEISYAVFCLKKKKKRK